MFKKNTNRYRLDLDKAYKVKNAYNKLKIDKKITEEFEDLLQELSLEELIAIKLHVSTKYLNNKLTLHIFDNIYHSILSILIIYGIFNYKDLSQVAHFLGVDLEKILDVMRDANLYKYYHYIKKGVHFNDDEADLNSNEIFQEIKEMAKKNDTKSK
jgi:hypothetical protein